MCLSGKYVAFVPRAPRRFSGRLYLVAQLANIEPNDSPLPDTNDAIDNDGGYIVSDRAFDQGLDRIEAWREPQHITSGHINSNDIRKGTWRESTQILPSEGSAATQRCCFEYLACCCTSQIVACDFS